MLKHEGRPVQGWDELRFLIHFSLNMWPDGAVYGIRGYTTINTINSDPLAEFLFWNPPEYGEHPSYIIAPHTVSNRFPMTLNDSYEFVFARFKGQPRDEVFPPIVRTKKCYLKRILEEIGSEEKNFLGLSLKGLQYFSLRNDSIGFSIAGCFADEEKRRQWHKGFSGFLEVEIEKGQPKERIVAHVTTSIIGGQIMNA